MVTLSPRTTRARAPTMFATVRHLRSDPVEERRALDVAWRRPPGEDGLVTDLEGGPPLVAVVESGVRLAVNWSLPST